MRYPVGTKVEVEIDDDGTLSYGAIVDIQNGYYVVSVNKMETMGTYLTIELKESEVKESDGDPEEKMELEWRQEQWREEQMRKAQANN
ncbi:hypothetical protein Trisim1_011675 [Trichoderma cf. simile WF8]